MISKINEMIKNILLALFFTTALAVLNGTGLHFYPILDYSDETSLTGGATLYYLYRKENMEKSVPPSMLKLQLEAGLRKNWAVELDNEWQLEYGKYAIRLPIKAEQQDCEIYGIGENIALDQYFQSSYQHFSYNFRMLRRWENYNFGFTYKGSYVSFSNVESVWLQNWEGETKIGGWTIGPGLTFQYNTLDNQLFPQNGWRINMNMNTYSEALRSEYTFERYMLELAGFLKILKMTTWATEFSYIANIGEVPYQDMASLGDELRIFRKGQYLDMILFTGVSEIRSFPWKKGFRSRIGFVVFAEIGQVQPEMSKFNLSDNHWGFGIGLRYILNMDELLTIRLDSGMHKDQISTDFGAKEAF